ncbi:MAG: DUF819 family protein [Saprospiraceae bacterium]|nr:DUF819 family protein [Saprospiraceae bacterium]MCB9323406.1 DUF819 family protein [Lewinellaceae bacterium]
MIWIILQLLIIITMPWAGKVLHKKPFFSQWMSPVVFCYGIGIIIRNLNLFPLDEHLSNYITQGTIILAIPLLLFSTKILKWLKYTGKGLLSFGLCVISALLGSTLAWYTLGDTVSDPGRLSGMLVGIYTGGTPNMQAIGMALRASQEDIILVNAADMLMGGAYLVFLSTIAHRVLKGILPDFEAGAEGNPEPTFSAHKKFNLKHSLTGVGLSLIIAAIAITIPLLIFGNMDHIALIILGLTTFSIMAAFIPAVQNLESTFETGDYLLLMFCVALGLLADFSAIFEKGADLILYAGVAMFSSILLHFLFAKIFKIDRDTFIITSTAGIFGPVFIGQIAAVLGNRKLVFTGITLGLLGYAIGNFLGIGLAELLRML